MTKKIIYSSILAMMLLGCGSGDSSSTDNKTSNNQEQQQEEIENRVENNQTNQVNEISLKSENRNVSTTIDIKYLSENNVKKLIDILNQNGYKTFSQKHIDTIYSDFDENGKEFYIITFDEDGYIILNPNLNSNALYGLDETNIYNSISQTEKTTINIDWMSIIADEVEIPFEKLKKAYQKTGDRKLITKITWTSSAIETDFDLIVKSPNRQICNWQWDNRNKEDWGTIFLKDDQGMPYKKSYEAFSVDLDKMDEYATKNNLFGIDEGKYKFYVVRYAGDNIEYNFSFGVNEECSANNANDCPNGNWKNRASIKHQEYYSVYYKPKKVSTNSEIFDKVLSFLSVYFTINNNQKALNMIDSLKEISMWNDYVEGFEKHSDSEFELVLYSLEFFLRHSESVFLGEALEEDSITDVYQNLNNYYIDVASHSDSTRSLYLKIEEPGRFYGTNTITDAEVTIYPIKRYTYTQSDYIILDETKQKQYSKKGTVYGLANYYDLGTTKSGLYVVKVVKNGKTQIKYIFVPITSYKTIPVTLDERF